MTRSPYAPLPLACFDSRDVGVPVLLVHGFGHNHAVWSKLAASLPAGLRPIAVDLRGHGASPWSAAGEYDLPCYAEDLEALCESLGLDRLHVVAHSLGGNVATLFAAATRSTILSLTLVDTGPALESSGSDHVVEEVENALRSFGSMAEYRAWLAQIHPAGDREILDGLAAAGLVRRLDGRYEPAIDPGALGDGGTPEQRTSTTQALWESLASIRCPVLVVRGGLSAILSERVAQAMVEDVLADGRLVTVPGAGHGVMLDDPEGLARVVGEFLATPNAGWTRIALAVGDGSATAQVAGLASTSPASSSSASSNSSSSKSVATSERIARAQ